MWEFGGGVVKIGGNLIVGVKHAVAWHDAFVIFVGIFRRLDRRKTMPRSERER